MCGRTEKFINFQVWKSFAGRAPLFCRLSPRTGTRSSTNTLWSDSPKCMIRQNLFPAGAMIRFSTPTLHTSSGCARVTAPLFSPVTFFFPPPRHVFLLFFYLEHHRESPITLSRSVRERQRENDGGESEIQRKMRNLGKSAPSSTKVFD